ncbi:MAG TPA: sigma-70 family RNA polymerase sigma factor [bacterium]|nr:sigma-70 family RNA polymerase sigma factor [bacterium]
MTEHERQFQRLHDENRERILRYLTRLAGAAAAEDIAQETFIRAYRALAEFGGEAQAATWLYRIATNCAHDHFRRTAARGGAAAGDEALASIPVAAEQERQAIRHEAQTCISDLVQNLPESYRVVLTLSDMEGLADREVAEVLGLSVSTAKMRLHRARARMKRLFADHCCVRPDEESELGCIPKGGGCADPGCDCP